MLRPMILDDPDEILQLDTSASRQQFIEIRDFQAVHHLQSLVNQSHRQTEQPDAEIVTFWSGPCVPSNSIRKC